LDAHLVLADAWYSSGTFWGAASAIAVTAFGILGIFISYRQANPIQRLGYGMSQAPLLQDSAQALPTDLKIAWQNEELRDPHIVEISIISNGRQDISPEDFQGQPLEFRLEGAEVRDILRTSNSPGSAPPPHAAIEDGVLMVGPSSIRRRQSTKFTLLVEGAQPTLRTPSETLHNVDLVNLAAEPSRRPRVVVRSAIGVTAAGVAAGLVVLGVVIGRVSGSGQPSPAATPPPASSSTLAPATGIPTDVAVELKSADKSDELSAITALQNLMKSSPADQPTAISDLTTFIHRKSPATSHDVNVTHIVQVALNVLRTRNPANDGGATIVLGQTNLTGANLSGIDLSGANLVDTDFDTAILNGANLSNADLSFAFVGGAQLAGTNLSGATLSRASFYLTTMCHGSKPVHPADGYNCKA
jgi:pentapeptide repeat protein